MKIKRSIAGWLAALCLCTALVLSGFWLNSSVIHSSSSEGHSAQPKSLSNADQGSNESASPSTVPTKQANLVNPTAQGSGRASAAATASNRPVSLVGGHLVSYPGRFAQASVQVGSQKYTLTPNQLGNFQRINVAAKQVVNVQVSYPQGQVGDPVAIEVEDGGHLDNKQMSEVAALDNQNSVQFQFQPTDQSGIYRIALRSGADVKVVNFWVGQEPQVRE